MNDAQEKDKQTVPVSKLGRGLGRLIPVKPVAAAQATVAAPAPIAQVKSPAQPTPASASAVGTGATETGSQPSSGRRIQDLEISKIRPNSRQPRRDFDAAAINELADSIRSAGLLQPVVVRPVLGSKDQYELIAGERRLRACKSLGWERIPAILTQATDQDAGIWALIENVHRTDLNPMDRAISMKQLASEFRLTHEALAEQVGLDRSSVSNMLRLAELDEGTATLVRKGLLTQGHAKALLAVPNLKTRGTLAESSVRGDWSVRALEREVQRVSESISTEVPRGTKSDRRRSNVDALERKLSQILGTDVSIQTGRKPNTGRLQISFYSLEQFEGLVSALGIKPGQINVD
jgi:ParB family chromosome partitioning protein